MTGLAHLCTRLGDLLAALASGSPAVLLVIASVLFAVLALLIFRWATPQQRLAAARSRLLGRLLEAALYQDDLRVILRVQAGVVAANLRYLVLALPALAALALPLLLVLPQLEARLGRRALDVGEAALVSAVVPAATRAVLVPTGGLAVEAGPVHDAARGELVWRVRALAPGQHALGLRLEPAAGSPPADAGSGPDAVTLALPVPVATDGLAALTAARHGNVLAQLVRDPAGQPLPADQPIGQLAITLPGREVRILGLALPWWLAFTILSLLIGLLLRRPLRVEL